MEFNYDFYIASAAIMAILICYHYIAPHAKTLSNRLFGIFMVVIFINCVADSVFGLVLSKTYSDNVPLNMIGLVISFSAQHLVTPMYCLLMVTMARGYEKLPKNTFIGAIPVFVVQFLIYCSPWYGYAFRYTAQNGYERSPLLGVLVAVSAFYIIFATLEVWFNGKQLGKVYQLISTSYLAISIIFIVIQMFYKKYVILSAGAAMVVIVIQLVLQNPLMIKEANEKEIEARKAAEEANEAKSAFLANMSHEMRTPMNAILGMLEILDKSDLGKKEKEYVHTIREASDSLMVLVERVLDFSKLKSGKLSIREEEYDFGTFISNIEQNVAQKIGEKDIELQVNIGKGFPKLLKGDKTKVNNMLLNILDNAVKFTDKGKIVLDISFEMRDNNVFEICFCVTDTGIGIKNADMKKIFSRFNQLDGKRNRKADGTGIGLSMSKELAKLMNGDIIVQSEENVGSRFEVTIEQQLIKLDKLPTANEISGYKVYIYEDDYDVPWHITKLLSQLGISAVIVRNEVQLESIRNKSHSRYKTVLFYAYAKNHDFISKANIPFRTVGVVPYSYDIEDEYNYIKKPFDIIKLRRILFEEYMENNEEDAEKEIKLNDVRIALVDDNKVNLKVAATMLKEFGAKIEAFTSGEGILKAVKMGRQYDIIFMDHMMPEMDGVEATKRIRSMPGKYNKSVKIIALTANVVDGVEAEFEEAGMNDCLFKPASMEKFRQTLIKHLPEDKYELM